MIYNKEELERFAGKPFKYEDQQVKGTHVDIRKAIETNFIKKNIIKKHKLTIDLDYHILLQGSYKNDTDVTKSSDVDVVVQLKSLFHSNIETLPAEQLKKHNLTYSTPNYGFKDFKTDILNALLKHFNEKNVSNHSKCIKIKEHDKFCNADVIPCLTYRKYENFESEEKQSYVEGIWFESNDKAIINYPKQHYENLTKKSESMNGNFKSTVRMFKNIKDDLIERKEMGEDVAKSYFIENLLFNVSDECFKGNYTEIFKATLNYLIEQYNDLKIQGYLCANGITPLFDTNAWSIDKAYTFLEILIKVRDESKL